MSEMVERVGNAILLDLMDRRDFRQTFAECDDEIQAEIRDAFGRAAIAAIAAMHEPTEAMTDDGRFHGEANDFVRPTAEDAAVKRLSTSYVRSIWQTMISAALK